MGFFQYRTFLAALLRAALLRRENPAILAGTDAAGAGAGVEEALNCWEEGAHEAETLEALAEFGD